MNASDRRPRARETGLHRATGRDRDEWFATLDAWGAPGRPYREIADWLQSEHGLSQWWAQKLIVEFEEARGLRPPGVRRDGSFEVGASKIVAASVKAVERAFLEPDVRESWLPSAILRERTPRSERSLRFDWEGGPSRIAVGITPTGTARTQIVVQHENLPDAATADEMKTFWRERLTRLKAVLEG